jgi:hypothetical protein
VQPLIKFVIVLLLEPLELARILAGLDGSQLALYGEELVVTALYLWTLGRVAGFMSRVPLKR